MMHPNSVQALGQARLAELHRQARRGALARTAGQARRARKQQSGNPGSAVPAAATTWARRLRPAPEGSLWQPLAGPLAEPGMRSKP
jgi:hypothetical protein